MVQMAFTSHKRKMYPCGRCNDLHKALRLYAGLRDDLIVDPDKDVKWATYTSRDGDKEVTYIKRSAANVSPNSDVGT